MGHMQNQYKEKLFSYKRWKIIYIYDNIKEIYDNSSLSDEGFEFINDPQLNVMRCLTITQNEIKDKRIKNIFSIYVMCNKKRCMLVINEINIMNVISTHTITRVKS